MTMENIIGAIIVLDDEDEVEYIELFTNPDNLRRRIGQLFDDDIAHVAMTNRFLVNNAALGIMQGRIDNLKEKEAV